MNIFKHNRASYEIRLSGGELKVLRACIKFALQNSKQVPEIISHSETEEMYNKAVRVTYIENRCAV